MQLLPYCETGNYSWFKICLDKKTQIKACKLHITTTQVAGHLKGALDRHLSAMEISFGGFPQKASL